jgi:hypothetical protein
VRILFFYGQVETEKRINLLFTDTKQNYDVISNITKGNGKTVCR